MNLYHLYRKDEPSYDEYDGHVVLAKNEHQARYLVVNGRRWCDEGPDCWWHSEIEVVATDVNVAEPRVLLSSFNAG